MYNLCEVPFWQLKLTKESAQPHSSFVLDEDMVKSLAERQKEMALLLKHEMLLKTASRTLHCHVHIMGGDSCSGGT